MIPWTSEFGVFYWYELKDISYQNGADDNTKEHKINLPCMGKRYGC